MLDAESAQVVGDPWSMPPPARPFVSAVKSPTTPRLVAFTSNLGLSKVEPEVADICRAGVNSLRSAGVGVDDACPDLSGGIEAFQTLRALMFASVRGELLQKHREEIAPHIVWNLEKGINLTADEILRAERTRARIYANMVAFFRRFDVLACPVVAVPPFPVAQTYPTEIAGEKLQTYIDWMFLTFVITLTGCPAISVPCGFTASGLPVGLQLIGRPHGDYDLLAAAKIFEQIRGDLNPALPIG
jgi:amidase